MELHTNLRKSFRALGTVLVLAFIPPTSAGGQTAESLSQVKKVFVDSFGAEGGASDLREATIKALRKNGDLKVVATTSEADAVIRGSGKIWVTGSMHLGPHGGLSEKTYDGYLQVELLGKTNKTLWTFRATPSRFPWNGIVWDLASHVVKSLVETLRQNRNSGFDRDWLQLPVTNAQRYRKDALSPGKSRNRASEAKLHFSDNAVCQALADYLVIE